MKNNVSDFAEAENGPTITLIKDLAKKYNVYNVWVVSGAIVERDETGIYNTVFLVDRKGEVIGKYRKMHLYSAMDEDVGFKNGTESLFLIPNLITGGFYYR
jgi:predicted amidohydrolase